MRPAPSEPYPPCPPDAPTRVLAPEGRVVPFVPAQPPQPQPPQPLDNVLAAFEELVREQAAELARQNALLRRQNEELKEAHRLRGDFVAMVAHELRTPLTAVLGFSDLLLNGAAGGLNEDQSHYVSTIGRSGRRLLDLINDVLDLAKIDAGHMSFRRHTFDLREPVVESEGLVRALAQQKDQVLALDARDEVLCEGDPDRVRQVVLNLISNAVKFTPNGGRIQVTVSRSADGAWAELAVRDTGLGIAPEDHETIFGVFRQVDGPGGTGSQRGTGLGLALARRFCEAMGGDIRVQSALQQGATFLVRLPAVVAAR